MKISVIIPVYNKREFVGRCIESVLAQDFDSFEVIVVDDGSSDGGASLVDMLAKADSRVTVVHQENGGVTAARRVGLARSSGEYVMFVDADDELLPAAMRSTYDVIVKEKADYVIATYRDQYGNHYDSDRVGWCDTDEMIRNLLSTKNTFCVLWGILFRRDILDGCFDWSRELVEREDILGQIKMLMGKPRVYFIPDCIYLYNKELPNSRRMTVERLRLHDDLLRQVLDPRWSDFATHYYIYMLKTYEALIACRRFSVYREYYRDALRGNTGGAPFKDKIAIMLPPRMAYIPIKLYKWWINKR